MKKLQVLKPYYRVDECIDEIRHCLESGWTGLGGKTVIFEKAWKEYTNLPHAHFVNSATAGLHLAVKIFKDAYGWEEGDEIITTPLTFVSTNHAILYERLFPVFADVNPLSLCLDPQSVEKKITTRTRAVMYVGVGGSPGQLDEIRKLCKKHNLKLILDGAHMAGTKMWRNGKHEHVGKEADVTVFSFQAVKNLPTADAGMVCFQDPEFDARARKLSWLGIDKDTFLRTGQDGDYKWKYDVPDVGFKYNGNAIMAAIGLVQLRYLDDDNEQRRRLHGRYQLQLEELEKVKFIHYAGIGHGSSHHLCQIVVPNRDIVISSMNTRGVYPGVHYVDNTHYRMYRYAHGTCPVAHELSNGLLSLPLHLGMTEEDVDRVVTNLRIPLGE